jgi:hypothetical protein
LLGVSESEQLKGRRVSFDTPINFPLASHWHLSSRLGFLYDKINRIKRISKTLSRVEQAAESEII